MDAIEKHCQPKKNVVYERFKFLSCNQKEGQSVGSYITELKMMVKNCEYDSEEEMVLDKIVMGIIDNNVRERLLQTEVLFLRKAIDVCQIAEVSRHQTDQMATKIEGMSTRVDSINSSKLCKISNSNSNFVRNKMKKENVVHNPYHCKKCSTKHNAGQCPAFGKECFYCHELHHFEIGCLLKMSGNKQQNEIKRNNFKKKLHSVESQNVENSNNNLNEMFIDSLKITNGKNNNKLINNGKILAEVVSINDIDVLFKLDTGADCNILPSRILLQVMPSARIQK
ncbi:uncharacterized protein LOC123676482 [Harmonia axyridis]|uniref:uncharacterized protein LOC123676482 n=1 Tax=Harmonia axyridis TaxID=115357 RepID=UPI001E27911A|nr:uncharacterized protein LOC123676482 [Harmonia axyridis]